MKRLALFIVVATLAGGGCFSPRRPEIVIGAVYPTDGPQGEGGSQELSGLRLAAEFVNKKGGVGGQMIRIRPARADSAEAAPGAVRLLARQGIPVIVGTYSSSISRRAAKVASDEGIVFWETGAVGMLDNEAVAGNMVFRFAPTGRSLGRSAVAFVEDQLRGLIGRDSFSYAVTYVDDDYGRSVGLGAIDEIKNRGLKLAADLPYNLASANYQDLTRGIADSGADLLVVAAYLHDGVELRKAIIDAKVPLAASIGTSSSYCMPEFGETLGDGAVGLFASDKPDGDYVRPARLEGEGAEALEWARAEYRKGYTTPRGEMYAEVLSGFAGGWALFRHVLPAAGDFSSKAIAESARSVHLPVGSLPNGGGLEFSAGENVLAARVIWEWVEPGRREIVWPPALATGPIRPIQITR